MVHLPVPDTIQAFEINALYSGVAEAPEK